MNDIAFYTCRQLKISLTQAEFYSAYMTDEQSLVEKSSAKNYLEMRLLKKACLCMATFKWKKCALMILIDTAVDNNIEEGKHKDISLSRFS